MEQILTAEAYSWSAGQESSLFMEPAGSSSRLQHSFASQENLIHDHALFLN
jgi:hypothetical protein